MNFKNIHYLKSGSAIQKRAFQVLNELKVFKTLKDFDPILVGTIPLDIAIEGSDLDIILKQQGLKTEPAFAKYFNIPGDPYEELLKISNLSHK